VNGADGQEAEPSSIRVRSSVSEEAKWGGSLYQAHAPGDKDAMQWGSGDYQR
jgi:hypothetical protein